MFGLSTTMLVTTILIVLASGAVVAFSLARFNRADKRITLVEYGICAALLIVAFVPSVSYAGSAIANANAVDGYQEFWGGSITNAKSQETTCSRDGRCTHTYQCDPYQNYESYTTTETYYKNGKSHTRSVTKWHYVTRYHQCPYATSEYTYWLDDSFGQSHTIASHIFAANAREWRGGHSLPDIARGIPATWQKAKDSLAAGDAPPATKMNSYTNYLLAAQGSILSAYSDSVDKYRKENLLPYHTANLTNSPMRDGYQADKMVFAGISRKDIDNYDKWQQSLGRLNAYLGSSLQGDLHVLVVPASKIDDPENYTNAMLAYWQSRELGKLGLAKNAIMLVVGLSDDHQTVAWSRAKTGIPEGNGKMLSALSSLDRTSFVPETLIGWPKARTTGDKLAFTPSSGAVEQIVMRDYPFKRVCMDCKGKDDDGSGYVYLRASAYIPTSSQVMIYSVLAFLGLILFTLAALCDFTKFASAIRSLWREMRRGKRQSW